MLIFLAVIAQYFMEGYDRYIKDKEESLVNIFQIHSVILRKWKGLIETEKLQEKYNE